MSTRLPVPRPLPEAVANGHFGHDDNGPVSPNADEVREITENHAETLIDLVADLKEAKLRHLGDASLDECSKQIENAVEKYAQDFGGRAGEQLLAYARRQVLVNDPVRPPWQDRSKS